jgi:hypothetical protein
MVFCAAEIPAISRSLTKAAAAQPPFPQRAPFRVHDVVQVVVTPWSHFLQTATHCSTSFGLYEGYRSVAHLFIVPVASCSGEHAVTTTARTSKAAKRRMKVRPADDPMLTPNSDFRQCLPTTVHYRTALFQFSAYKKAGVLLNTRYEGSGGRPARIAAPAFVAQLRAMSLLFSCCRSAEEPGFKGPQAFARCGLPGLKCIRMKTLDPPAPVLPRLNRISPTGGSQCGSGRGTRGVLRNYDSIKSKQLASSRPELTEASTLEFGRSNCARFPSLIAPLHAWNDSF